MRIFLIISFFLFANFAGNAQAYDRRGDVTIHPIERRVVDISGRPVVVNNYYGNRGGYNGGYQGGYYNGYPSGNYGHGYGHGHNHHGRVPNSIRDRALIGGIVGGVIGSYLGSRQQYPQQYPPQGYPCNGYNCGQPQPQPMPMPQPGYPGGQYPGGNTQVHPIGVFNGQAVYPCPHGGFGTEQMCRAGQGSQQPPQGMQPVNGGYPGGQPGYPGGQGCQQVNGYMICPQR